MKARVWAKNFSPSPATALLLNSELRAARGAVDDTQLEMNRSNVPQGRVEQLVDFEKASTIVP
jgi:hypothetical protein